MVLTVSCGRHICNRRWRYAHTLPACLPNISIHVHGRRSGDRPLLGRPDVRRQQQAPTCTIIVVGSPEVIQLVFPLLYYYYFMAPAPCSSSCYSEDFGLFNFLSLLLAMAAAAAAADGCVAG